MKVKCPYCKKVEEILVPLDNSMSAFLIKMLKEQGNEFQTAKQCKICKKHFVQEENIIKEQL